MTLTYLIQVVWVIMCACGGVFYGRRGDAVGGPFGAGLGALLAMVFGCILIGILMGGAPGGYRPL